MHPAVDAIEDLHRKSFFDCAEKTARYKALTAKVTAYQSGDGPEPTEAEFLQWCNDVKLAIRLIAAVRPAGFLNFTPHKPNFRGGRRLLQIVETQSRPWCQRPVSSSPSSSPPWIRL